MAGGKWHPVQKIHPVTKLVQFPKGPLVLATGETPKWIDAWVVQSSTGSAQTCYGSATGTPSALPAFPTATEWTANVISYNKGHFKPGPAVGIALLYVRDGSKNEYFWWSDDPIELEF